MQHQSRTTDHRIARIASRSHGVVTRAQLLDAGISAMAITVRLRRGTLLRQHPGVYRVGHAAPSVEAVYLAAVLACGRHALLSGAAAGHLLGLLGGPAPPPEVTAPAERRVAGIATRRSRGLAAADGMRWRGVPVTTVPRTLVDLAGTLDAEALGRACHEAIVRFGLRPAHVDAALVRRPNARGAATLRRLLRGDEQIVLSRLERRFLDRLQTAGLPLPRTNRRIGRHYVDCRWEAQRVTVELDSYRFHASRRAWEQDRRRERAARARGDEFRRYSYADVVEDPRFMLRELAALLDHRPG